MLELMLTRPDERRRWSGRRKGCGSWSSTSCTPTAAARAPTSPCSCGACASVPGRRLRCVGTRPRWPARARRGAQAEVAGSPTRCSATEVRPENVIGETLVGPPGEARQPCRRPGWRDSEAPHAYAEMTTGPDSPGGSRRVRAGNRRTVGWSGPRPPGSRSPPTELAKAAGWTQAGAPRRSANTLRAGSSRAASGQQRPLFAFRLHQFLSKGDTVFVTLEEPARRHLTRDYQLVKPGSDGKILLPLAFAVTAARSTSRVAQGGRRGRAVHVRRDTSATGGKVEDGYLHVDLDNPWPTTVTDAIESRRLPDSWLEFDDAGYEVVRESYRKRLPRPITVDAYGKEGRGTLRAAFLPAPFPSACTAV